MVRNMVMAVAGVIALLLMQACGTDDSGDGGGGGGPAGPTAVTGMVLVTSWGVPSPIEGARVEAGGVSATTGVDGRFTLTDIPDDAPEIVVTATANDYLPQYATVALTKGQASYCEIYLLYRGEPIGTIDAAVGGSVVDDLDGMTGVEIPPGVVVDPGGQPYTGEVWVHLISTAEMAAESPEFMALIMPGGDFGAQNASGEDGVLLTYGFVGLLLTDPNGNTLFTGEQNLDVTMAVPPETAAAISSNTRNWRFDTASGQWQDAGPVEPVGGGGVRMDVNPQDLYWNCDDWLPSGGITGTVVNCENKPVAGATVMVTNASSALVTYSNSEGRFGMNIPADAASTVNVTLNGAPANPASVNVTVDANERQDLGQFVAGCTFEGTFSGSTTAENPEGCTYSIGISGTLTATISPLTGDISGGVMFTGTYSEHSSYKPPGVICLDAGDVKGRIPLLLIAGPNGSITGSGQFGGVSYTLSGGTVSEDQNQFTATITVTDDIYDADIVQNVALQRRQ